MNLETLKNDIPLQTARNAYAFTSFNPDKRGENEVRDYVITLTEIYNELKQQVKDDEMQRILDEQFEYFRIRFRTLTLNYLHTHSRLASWAVVGPSKFPSARMQKINASCDRRMSELMEFKSRGIKAIRKKMGIDKSNVIRSGESDTIIKLKQKISGLEANQEKMKAVNKIIRTGAKKGLSEPELVEQLKEFVYEPVARAMLRPDCLDRIGYRQFELSNNLAEIRRLKERLTAEEKRESKSSDGNKEYKFLCATIIENYEMNRLQISHDSIPDVQVRKKLKENGFHWSPHNVCWQRQLTDNAILTLKELIGDYTKERSENNVE